MAQHTTDPSELPPPPPDSIANTKSSRLDNVDSLLANPSPAMIIDSLLPAPSLLRRDVDSLLRDPRQELDSPHPQDATPIPSPAGPSIQKIPSLLRPVPKTPWKPSALPPDRKAHQNPTPLPEEKQKEGGEDELQARGKKGTKRCCGACRKSVGLVGGFKCRCGGLFCGVHRYSDRHECGFDYKAAGREAIARENPLVQATKIVRI